jgi:HipA-like C-terminal domain
MHHMTYPVTNITAFPPDADEQMGTKEKFWITMDNHRWLFKFVQKDYGEDWSEKITGEIASLLSIPVAQSCLAVYQNRRGILVKSFTDQAASAIDNNAVSKPQKVADLYHGNDLIAVLVNPAYPRNRRMKNQDHTLDCVRLVLQNYQVTMSQREEFALPEKIESAFDVFIGYLLLDTLVANTDRHHRNWGVRSWLDNRDLPHIAPSFDHASSLGRNLTDKQRESRLSSRDTNFKTETYCLNAPSRLYRDAANNKAMTTFEAFCLAAEFADTMIRTTRTRLIGLNT